MPYIPLEEHLPGITGLLEYRQDSAKPIRELTQILLRGPSTLTEGERELIATVVSNGNQCIFCTAAHTAAADVLLGENDTSEKVKQDIAAAPVSEKMKTLLTIAAMVRESGKAVTKEAIEKAKSEAKSENKFILLNFSGSDWCGPCIRLRKEIFDNEIFMQYAHENLVLVNADFPRLKKNMLSKEQQKQNDALANTYNSEGAFPLTLLLDKNGMVLKKWEGLPAGAAGDFTGDVKAAANANR